MSELIVKHNDFIEAKYNLTLTELKIIAKLSSMIQKNDDDFMTYHFTAKELLENLKLNNNYDDLRDAIRKLLTRLVIIKTENSILATTFLSSAEYFNDSTIELSFDKKLKPYLLQLKNNFTMYQFQNVVALSSFYAIRIYELCKQYEKIKERIIQIEELKEILDIKAKSYNRYDNFKRKVLEIAKREINEKTDININFKEIKTGRKVASIKFLIEKKEKEIEKVENKIDFEIENVKSFEDIPKKKVVKINKEYSEEVLKLFEILPLEEQVESSKEKLENLLKDHTFKFIEADIKYAKKSKVKNFWGYLLKSCREGHYSKDEVEKVEIKKINTENKLKQMQLMEEKAEEEKLRIEKENKARAKALEFYENLNENIKEKIKEKAKELYIQEGQIKDFNSVKKIYETTLEKLYIHRIIRNTFQDLIED